MVGMVVGAVAVVVGGNGMYAVEMRREHLGSMYLSKIY
jgi:hypothetical protein